MQKLFFWVLSLLVCPLVFGADEAWQNVGADARLGGRMISAGYLRGKVVLIDRRDYGDVSKANRQEMQQLQTLWNTYKTKPFILLGSHNGASDPKRAAALAKKLNLTYPLYNDAWYKDPKSEKPVPDKVCEVWDSTGQLRLYTGKDPRAGTGVVGGALMSAARPMTPAQFEQLLKYEVKHLPGSALLRLKEFYAKFPQEARVFDEEKERLSADEDVCKLAKLVELARLVKDRDTDSRAAKKLTPEILKKQIKKFEGLKKHANEFVAQEAKNALADITWVLATLEAKEGKTK